MLTVESRTYASGWGKLAGKHRIYTATIHHEGAQYAAQHEDPLTAALDAITLALYWLVTYESEDQPSAPALQLVAERPSALGGEGPTRQGPARDGGTLGAVGDHGPAAMATGPTSHPGVLPEEQDVGSGQLDFSFEVGH